MVKEDRVYIGLLPGYYAFHDVHSQRLDVNPVGNPLIRHDGGGVGVYQYGEDAFLAEGFARLGASVVKLRSLADHYRAGAYNQHFFRPDVFRPNRNDCLLGGSRNS